MPEPASLNQLKATDSTFPTNKGFPIILSSSCFCFHPSPAQLEQNASNRGLGIHPIILWQQEEQEKAKIAAASVPVDVKAMMSKIDRNK